MAELKERPEVRDLEVDLVIGASAEKRRGANLDDVFRTIVWDFKQRNHYTQQQTGDRLGISQQNVARILDEKLHGTSLDVLSRACIALKVSPGELFRNHERYRLLDDEERQYVEDAVFNRFRAVLSVDQARALLGVLDAAKERGGLTDLIQGVQRLTGSGATPATRRSRARQP